MSDWERQVPATAYPQAPVLPWPVGEPAPTLPAGTAGISVHVRSRWLDPRYFDKQKAVGIDDRPMWHGLGRMVAVTTPGEHLVEVRGRFSAETVRRVRVAAGETAELDYWVPASYGTVDGVLVPSPAERRIGARAWVFVAPTLVMLVLVLLAIAADLPVSAPLVAVVLLSFPVTAVLVSRLRRRADDAYRARVSTEATGDVAAADSGMFLGDGAPPAGLADPHTGALVVTGTARLEYTCNGHSLLQPATRDPRSWVRWPTLTIDGAPRPFSWRTWAYRLAPGEHEVTVAPRSPDGEAGPPVPVRVRITAGRVTRLDLRVTARTEVRAVHRGAPLPTELTGFAARVAPRVR